MLEDIYLEVIPEKGREQANIWYKSTLKNLQYVSTHKESGAALSTAISSMRFAVDYLIEANLGIESREYKKIGDAFFNTATKLHKEKKVEARQTVGTALSYYKQGCINIPQNIKKNWKQYQWNETTHLRTDWQTEDYDLMKLLN